MHDIKERIMEVIEDYIKSQPLNVRCSSCSEELNYGTEIDGDMDMVVYVDPCPNCTEE